MLREIESLLAITRGRAFLLFTSYAELRRVEEALLSRARHPLLVQGLDAQARLLDEFRRRKGAVLARRRLVLARRGRRGRRAVPRRDRPDPVRRPQRSLVAARIAARINGARRRALLRSTRSPPPRSSSSQGLGRLIRNRSDRGILAVLDSRLRTRGYGKTLLASIPPFPVVTDIEAGAPVLRGRARPDAAAAAGRRLRVH